MPRKIGVLSGSGNSLPLPVLFCDYLNKGLGLGQNINTCRHITLHSRRDISAKGWVESFNDMANDNDTSLLDHILDPLSIFNSSLTRLDPNI